MTKRALAVILGIGFGYRLLFIAKSQLRTDELMQALVVRSDSAAAMLDRMRGGGFLSTPLDPLLQRAAVFFLGESAWSLRLHAAILGALSVWLCYRVARFLFGERVALYTSALFALYPLHHHCSQEGLPYALSTFLTLLSYDLLLRLSFQALRGWLWWLALTGVEVLLLFSSPAGIAALLSQCVALVLCLVWKDNEGAVGERGYGEAREAGMRGIELKTVFAFAACAVLACALFWPWAHFAWAGRSVANPEALDLRLIRRIIKELGDGSYPFSGLLVVGLATGISVLLRHGRTNILPLLAAWFVIPPGVIYLLDRWAGDSLAIGQILPCTPPLILVAGYGVTYIGERLTILDRLPSQLGSPALVYAALFAIGSVAIAQSHWRRAPTDWQGAAQFLQETVRAGDTLIIPAGAPLIEYYAPRLAEFRSPESPSGAVAGTTDRTGRRILVCLNSLRLDPCADVKSVAKGGLPPVAREFAGLTVFTRE